MAEASEPRRSGRQRNSLWNDGEIYDLLQNSDLEMDDDDNDEDFTLEAYDSDENVAELNQDENIMDEPVAETFPCSSNKERGCIWKRSCFQGKAPNYKEDSVPILHPEPKTPIHYFKTFFPGQFFEDLSYQTNLYSVQTKGHSVNSNKEELLIMTGIQIIMGTLGMPQLRMYWSHSFLMPMISKCMTRDRFKTLRNLIHFVDNLNHEKNSPDKLWKVRPLLDHFRSVCLTIPRNNVSCIDEQMIPFNGRCPARQYLPSKPNPVGLKVFVLAATDGAMLDFLVYQGKGSTADDDNKSFGVGGAVVKALVQTYPEGKDPIYIYTDRYFTGINIANYLLAKGIYLTGTIMSNRTDNVNQKMTADKIMKKGEWDEWVRQDEKFCITKWKDTKSVLLLSSAFGSEPAQTCMRWSKEEKVKVEVKRPAVVGFYNSAMGGVDLMDRFVAYYRNSTKTLKWTVRVYAHFIDLGVVNSWILYKRDALNSGMEKKSLLTLMDFRLQVAESIIKSTFDVTRSPRPGRPSKSHVSLKQVSLKQKLPIPDIRFDQKNHFPEHVRGRNQARCRLPGCPGKSRVRCIKCEVFLCLQSRNCFLAFHTK